MAKYRSVHIQLWHDPKMEKLSGVARAVFVYLLTSPYRNEACLFSISFKAVSDHTGFSMKEIGKAFEDLIAAKRIMYDFEEEVVWVVKALGFPPKKNENCKKSAAADFELCRSIPLKDAFFEAYEEYLEGHISEWKVTHANGFETHLKMVPIPIPLSPINNKSLLGGVGEKKVFVAPSREECLKHFQSKGYRDPEAESLKFFNHFENNGWKVSGKNLMRNWHLAASTWNLNSVKFTNARTIANSNTKQPIGHGVKFDEGFFERLNAPK